MSEAERADVLTRTVSNAATAGVAVVAAPVVITVKVLEAVHGSVRWAAQTTRRSGHDAGTAYQDGYRAGQHRTEGVLTSLFDSLGSRARRVTRRRHR